MGVLTTNIIPVSRRLRQNRWWSCCWLCWGISLEVGFIGAAASHAYRQFAPPWCYGAVPQHLGSSQRSLAAL